MAWEPGDELGEVVEPEAAPDSQLVDRPGQGLVGEPRGDVEDRARRAGHANLELPPYVPAVNGRSVGSDAGRSPAGAHRDLERLPPPIEDAPQRRSVAVAEKRGRATRKQRCVCTVDGRGRLVSHRLDAAVHAGQPAPGQPMND